MARYQHRVITTRRHWYLLANPYTAGASPGSTGASHVENKTLLNGTAAGKLASTVDVTAQQGFPSLGRCAPDKRPSYSRHAAGVWLVLVLSQGRKKTAGVQYSAVQQQAASVLAISAAAHITEYRDGSTSSSYTPRSSGGASLPTQVFCSGLARSIPSILRYCSRTCCGVHSIRILQGNNNCRLKEHQH